MQRRVLAFAMALSGVITAVAETPVVTVVPAEPLTFIEPAEALGRVWVRPGDQVTESGIHVLVRYAESFPASEHATFECEIECKENEQDSIVGFKLLAPDGSILESGSSDLDLVVGVNRCDFVWDPAILKDGEYIARIYVSHPLRGEPSYRDLRLIKIGEGTLHREMEAARESLAHLTEHITPLLNAGVSVLGARFSLATEYMRVAEEFAVHGDWPSAVTVARYVTKTTTSIRAFLAFAPESAELLAPLPQPDMSAITIRNGTFYAGDQPVFLFGWNQRVNDATEFATPHRFGLNASVVTALPQPQTTPDTLRQRFDALFASAREQNVAVTVVAPIAAAAPWTPPSLPETMDALQPVEFLAAHQAESRAAMESYIRSLMPVLKDRPALLSVALADKPGFRMEGSEVLAAFSDYVKQMYPDRLAVNRAWQTRFSDFSEIEVWWTNDRPSYQYDWQSFQQQTAARFFGNLTGLVRGFLPSIPIQIRYADNVFALGQTRLGVDHETLSALTQISGCAVATGLRNGEYALDYPRSAVMYAFLRSIAPDQPIYNTEQGLWSDADPYAEYSYEYVHAVMWDGAIEGQDGSALADGLTTDLTDIEHEIYGHPASFEGYVTASVNINRLAPIVAAFQSAPEEVSILLSMPSLVINDGDPYLQSLLYAFEGVSQSGRKTGFITEEQIRAGKLSQVKILVIPNMSAISDAAFDAVNDYILNHGIVVRAGTTLPYNAWGHSRTDIVSRSLETVHLQESAQATQFYHAMDAVDSRIGVAQVPHIINNFYYPFEGIKSRFLIIDGVPYLYMLSLRHEAETVYVTGGYHRGRDLIDARDVEFPMTLQPLDPMLIQLEIPDSGLPGPDAVAAAPTGVPTITVSPVVPEVLDEAPPASQPPARKSIRRGR